MAPGRNDPCPCGSGRKFKKCCLGARFVRADEISAPIRNPQVFVSTLNNERPLTSPLTVRKRWWVEVTFTSDIDLLIFHRALHGSPIRPIITENRSFFEWEALDSCQDFSQASRMAERFLPKPISSIRLQSQHFQGLEIESVVEWPAGGGPQAP